ncbi:recombinase family protein [Mycetocola reblochoni]|uniref:recombinase family protein n=1 Tax=Mycetocola reblochoni TaxID=331618 RepID=UPI003F956E5B
MNALIYRRSAVHNLQRLDDQETNCRQYARQLGLTVDGSYYDIGRTGDGLATVLDLAQQEEVSAVIVNDLARLGEKMNDHLATMRRLHEAGVTIHVANEKTTDVRGALLVGVMQAYAEADSHLADYSHSNGPDD